MFQQQVSYTTQQSQGAYTAPVQQEDKNAHPEGIRLVERLSWGHVGRCFTHFTLWKGQSQIHGTGCKLWLSWGKWLLERDYWGVKWFKNRRYEFVIYSGGTAHVNPSTVRKLTDLKANGVNYSCFLRWSLQTSCVKLSSHEHHSPVNYHDPCRAGSL